MQVADTGQPLAQLWFTEGLGYPGRGGAVAPDR